MKKILTQIALFVIVFCTIALAVDIELVGTIHEGLYSPTSLSVSSDGIAVLEPYSSQIKLFTVEGLASYKVNIDGDAHSLTRISENQYLFCERNLKKIIQVDLLNETQHIFLDGSSEWLDPVDLVLSGDTLHVLDGKQSMIISYDLNGVKQSEISLLDEENKKLTFAASFDRAPSLNWFYVLEQTTSTVYVYTSSGEYVNHFSSFGNKSGEITRGGEIATDNNNRVFVTDRFQGYILSFDSEGHFLTNIGDTEGLPRLTTPTGLDIDESGIIYVASTMSAQIFMFHSAIYSTSQLVQAGLVSPENEATIEIDEISLMASAELSRPDIVISFIEFEIYDNQESSTELEPIATHRGRSTLDENTLAITSTWNVSDSLGLVEGNRYKWRTRVGWDDNFSDWSTWRTFSLSITELPTTFTLSQNYPNPFNPATLITFSLETTAPTQLEIFNMIGQRVKVLIDETKEVGNYEIYWTGTDDNGRRVATGIYFYRLTSGMNQQTKKMVLIK